ncbi:MAG: rRNA maturation RNase YbeY [Bacteroidetes bacterium]|nr:rRNA maturation RNase YbeY [Bacteroidota bacterium]
MAEIHFFKEGISFRLNEPHKIRRWIERLAAAEGRQIGGLTYVFCSDPFLLRLNKEYLHHHTLTDIITFDLSEDSLLRGEIYISIPRVRSNARSYGQPFRTELHRVIAHGLLHLLGYKDKLLRDKALMRQKEEACLSLWPSST